MKILLRADGGAEQGTGHVMRCLTLGEELQRRGHELQLMTAEIDVDWLRQTVERSEMTVHRCAPDSLPQDEILAIAPDWVVIDSYRIPSSLVSSLDQNVPVLAVVDGDARNITATLYLDQNLGADDRLNRMPFPERFLAGSSFALVRSAILDARRDEPWRVRGARTRVLCFMGGSDPTAASVGVARSLAGQKLLLTIIAPETEHDELRSIAQGEEWRILAPTPKLPSLFAEADIVISAAGTSAWDLCTLGIPSVLIAVVENQQPSLCAAVEHGLALGLDVVDDRSLLAGVRDEVHRLISDESLRHELSGAARRAFDGNGAARVAERMESATIPRPTKDAYGC